MAIKKGDFIELDYIGKVAQTNEIFDLTNEKIAKENKVYDEKAHYGPVIVCVGENDLVKGLDNFIEGKEPGKYKVELKSDDAFGKRDNRLVKVFPTTTLRNMFQKQGYEIEPMPRMQVNIAGLVGLIKTVTGGRTLVDFNHPLAGKDLVYEIEIKRTIEDDKEKLIGYTRLYLDAETELNEGKAVIKIKEDLPKGLKEKFSTNVKRLIPGIKEIAFEKITTETKDQ